MIRQTLVECFRSVIMTNLAKKGPKCIGAPKGPTLIDFFRIEAIFLVLPKVNKRGFREHSMYISILSALFSE